MTHFTIRPAIPADVSDIHQMIVALARYHGDAASLTPDRLAFLMTQGWPKITMAQIDDAIVGYAALCPISQLQFGKQGFDIHHFLIAQQHRNKGFGRLFIQALLDHAKSEVLDFVTVGTHPDNHAAKAFYVACGFEQFGYSGRRFRRLI